MQLVDRINQEDATSLTEDLEIINNAKLNAIDTNTKEFSNKIKEYALRMYKTFEKTQSVVK